MTDYTQCHPAQSSPDWVSAAVSLYIKPAQELDAAIDQRREVRESQLDPLLVDSFLALQKSCKFEDIRRIQAGEAIPSTATS